MASMSGVELDEESNELISKDLKGHVYKYVVFKIDNGKTISVDIKRHISELDSKKCKTVEEDKKEFERLGKLLPEDGMRYIMYTYVNEHNNFKRCFIRWLGLKSKTTVRMLYASSESAILNKFGLIKKLLIEDEFKYPEDFQAKDRQEKYKN